MADENPKPRLTPWENVKQLSATAWENWLTVTAALVVLIGSLSALAYPLYSSYAAKQQAAKDEVNNKITDLQNRVGALEKGLISTSSDAKHASEDARLQQKRLDDILVERK